MSVLDLVDFVTKSSVGSIYGCIWWYLGINQDAAALGSPPPSTE